jgi:hypothetical protein
MSPILIPFIVGDLFKSVRLFTHLLYIDRSDTQPTRSKMERVKDDPRFAFGGTKVGKGAWGIAWIDTYIDDSEFEPTPQPSI